MLPTDGANASFITLLSTVPELTPMNGVNMRFRKEERTCLFFTADHISILIRLCQKDKRSHMNSDQEGTMLWSYDKTT